MPWTTEYQTLLESYASTYGLPALDGDAARAWTRQLAEQFSFSFPGEGWGTKQASNTRPPSTDVICTRMPFVGYDVIVSQGTPGQTLAHNPEPMGLAGQVYIAVEPIDHLGGATGGGTPGTPAVPTYPYPDEPTAVRAYQDRIEATYVEAGRIFPDPDDSDAFRWFSRYGYDCNTIPEPDAANKHIADLRKELGLKP